MRGVREFRGIPGRGFGIFGKVITLAVVLVTMSVLGGLLTTRAVGERMTTAAKEQEADTLRSWITADIASQEEAAARLAALVSRDPDVVAAFAARDRQKLQSLTMPAFTQLKAEHGVAQFQFHTPPATSFLRLHKPEKFGDDLSSFRATVLDANTGKTVAGGAEGGVAGLGVRSVAPISYQGKHVGTVEFGSSLGESYVTRLSENLGAQVELRAPAKADEPAESVASTLPKEFTADPEAVRQALKGKASLADVMVGETPHFALYEPVMGYKDTVVAVVVVLKDAGALAAARDSAQKLGILTGLGLLLLGVGLAAAVAQMIARSVIHPVHDISAILRRLSDGDLTVRAEESGDRAIRTLASQLNATLDTISTTMRAVLQASRDLATTMGDMRQVTHVLGDTASKAATVAGDVNHVAEDVAESVAQAAAGAEQMSASIREIAGSAAEAARVGGSAVANTEVSNEQIGHLAETSAQIGDVVRLISTSPSRPTCWR